MSGLSLKAETAACARGKPLTSNSSKAHAPSKMNSKRLQITCILYTVIILGALKKT